MSKKNVVTRTPEERKDLLEKINASIKEGVSVADACKKVGVNQFSYYGWKSKAAGGKKPTTNPKKRRTTTTPELMTINYGSEKPLVILLGDPTRVQAALDRLATIFQ